jgi:hypothetical protein
MLDLNNYVGAAQFILMNCDILCGILVSDYLGEANNFSSGTCLPQIFEGF